MHISAKLVPVGYGIKKLQISCVVEDDKVSTDDLEDEIVGIEDYVSSTETLPDSRYLHEQNFCRCSMQTNVNSKFDFLLAH